MMHLLGISPNKPPEVYYTEPFLSAAEILSILPKLPFFTKVVS
jgi:hypothetical protein